MTLGRRRRERQETFWVATDRLGSGPRNAFYDRLNQLLDEIDFDRKLERAAEGDVPSVVETRDGLTCQKGIFFNLCGKRARRNSSR